MTAGGQDAAAARRSEHSLGTTDSETRMPAAELVELPRTLGAAAIDVWLDGGWGVDALLGRQIREHSDVDLILPVVDVPEVRRILAPWGFILKSGSPPDSFVLADGAGLEIDIHAVTFDGEGNGVYRMQNGRDWVYPAEGFTGLGTVGGFEVRCLTPEVQVLCHAHGYEPSEKDFHDMDLLKRRFDIDLPPQLVKSPG